MLQGSPCNRSRAASRFPAPGWLPCSTRGSARNACIERAEEWALVTAMVGWDDDSNGDCYDDSNDESNEDSIDDSYYDSNHDSNHNSNDESNDDSNDDLTHGPVGGHLAHKGSPPPYLR